MDNHWRQHRASQVEKSVYICLLHNLSLNTPIAKSFTPLNIAVKILGSPQNPQVKMDFPPPPSLLHSASLPTYTILCFSIYNKKGTTLHPLYLEHLRIKGNFKPYNSIIVFGQPLLPQPLICPSEWLYIGLCRASSSSGEISHWLCSASCSLSKAFLIVAFLASLSGLLRHSA